MDSGTLLDISSAAGILILSVPAFSLNFRKKTLARIGAIVRSRRQRGDSGALDTIAAELEEDATRRAHGWRRIDEICLFIGYTLLLGAAIGRVFL